MASAERADLLAAGMGTFVVVGEQDWAHLAESAAFHGIADHALLGAGRETVLLQHAAAWPALSEFSLAVAYESPVASQTTSV